MDPYEKILSPAVKKNVPMRTTYKDNLKKKNELNGLNDCVKEEETNQEDIEEDDETNFYNLRKRQPVVYQYQPVIQVLLNDMEVYIVLIGSGRVST